MIMRGGPVFAFGFLSFLSLLVGLAITVLVIWALILWIRAASRWLKLNPDPDPKPAAVPSSPEAVAAAAWLNTNETPAQLAQRLQISGEAASRIHRLALRVAVGAASPAELAEFTPWLPRLRAQE